MVQYIVQIAVQLTREGVGGGKVHSLEIYLTHPDKILYIFQTRGESNVVHQDQNVMLTDYISIC